jgi:hypothetical protein
MLRRRREPGLRQDELAELANCPTRMVQTLENGKLLEKLRATPMPLPTAVRAATSCQHLSDLDTSRAFCTTKCPRPRETSYGLSKSIYYICLRTARGSSRCAASHGLTLNQSSLKPQKWGSSRYVAPPHWRRQVAEHPHRLVREG